MACTLSETQRPNMQEFFEGKQVFLTGGTGFMGKCLLEKLLRSLQGLKRVIVLVRPKKEKTARQRLDELLSSKVSKILWPSEKVQRGDPLRRLTLRNAVA
jgi:fatty acyl-CoA reductase